MARLLLKNGNALIHGADGTVRATRTDIQIRGNKIVQIGSDLTMTPSDRIIDCSDKIVCPGFIDTHHHVWQTQLKGRHADHTLVEYMVMGALAGKLYNAKDVFWGQLAGCLEMVHNGTTTVADYANINLSPDHNFEAISASVASGIRSIYCFCPGPRLNSTVPFDIELNGLGGHSMSTFEKLCQTSPWGQGRVKLGIAFDGFTSAPTDLLKQLTTRAQEFGIQLIQTHYTAKPGKASVPQALDKMGLLDERFLIAHSVGEDGDLLRKRRAHVSSTPSTELQMSMGFPVSAFQNNAQGIASLGVDCHSVASSYIPGEARIALQSARAARGEVAMRAGKTPRTVGPTVDEAFNLATIKGAEAMKMAEHVGSIAEGKMADLILFSANTPSMMPASVQNPVAALMLHSSPADIDTVIIDGIIRKENGRLVDVDVETTERSADRRVLTWIEIAKNVLESRERIQREWERVDIPRAIRSYKEAFRIDESTLTDFAD